MALDGAKFICLSEAAAAANSVATETTPSSVDGKVAGSSTEDALAEQNTVIDAKGRKFTVGYYMSCDYVLEDSRAEGVHCEIQCDAFGRVTIHNISEAHPISVNGQIIKCKRPLLEGSRITILDRNFLWKFPKTVEVTATDTNKQVKTMSNKEDTSTPQKVVAPEQAPNSCPDLKPHRRVDKRFTVHNFAYCINSDEEGNTSTELPSINESLSVEEASSSSKESTEKKEELKGTETVKPEMSTNIATRDTADDDNKGSNEERRSITPDPQPHTNALTLTASTPLTALAGTPKMNLINCTQNKENKSSEKNRRLISLCQQSDVVITSFSPRETGVRIEKSFTAILKPITAAATTPKSVYSTPKSVICDSNDEGSRDFIDFTTPATSKKTFGARAIARNSSMHLIDLTTPSKLAPASMRARATVAALKRNQTLPTNVKLSTTPLTFAKLVDAADDDDEEEGIADLAVTPKMELQSATHTAATSTPQSAESVITVDGSSSDSSTHVIDISTEDSGTPSISSPVHTNLIKSTKTPQRPVTSTPQRMQTPSLMKRALLTSAKKNVSTTNRSSPATRPQTTSTPTARNIKLALTSDTNAVAAAAATTASTPKSSSRVAIGSPSNVAAAQRRFLCAKPRRSLAAVGIVSPAAVATVGIATSTPLNPRQTQTRNVPASAPRFSMVKRTSPLRGVRKSICGVTLSSHISKTRRSVISPKKRSPTSIVAQHVTKARKTLCIANANKSQIASRSRSLVAAAVNATNKAKSAKDVPAPKTATEETDLSRTFILDDDSVKEQKPSVAIVEEKAQHITFSPIKENTATKTEGENTTQQELNKTFSPDKPVKAPEVVEIKHEEIKDDSKNEKSDAERISESFAEVVASNANSKDAVEIETNLKTATEPQQKSDEISTNQLFDAVHEVMESKNRSITESKDTEIKKIFAAPDEVDDTPQTRTVSSVQSFEEKLDTVEVVSSSALAPKTELRTNDELKTLGSVIEPDNGADALKPTSESQGTAELLEEIEYVLNKSDELKQQLSGKEEHNTINPKDELENLELAEEVNANVKNVKEAAQANVDAHEDVCLPTTSTATDMLPTTSKVIFSVKSNMDEKEEEDKTSIYSEIMQATFEIDTPTTLDGLSIKTEILSITTNTTPSEFEVSSFGASSIEKDARVEPTKATLHTQENLNEKKDDLKLDLTNDVSSIYLVNVKQTVMEETDEVATGEIEDLNASTAASKHVIKSNNLESVVEKESDLSEEEEKEKSEEKNTATVAELQELAQHVDAVVELAVDESFALESEVTAADTEEIIEPDVKANDVDLEEVVKLNLKPDKDETVTTLQVTGTTTEECKLNIVLEDTATDNTSNSDEEKENKKEVDTEIINKPLATVVTASKPTAFEPKTPNLTGIRDLLRTPKYQSKAVPGTPRSVGLVSFMRTPIPSTSAAVAANTLTEDDAGEELLTELQMLPKTPQQCKKSAQTPQLIVETNLSTPRRSARRRASANADLTPTRCLTPTLDTNTDVSTILGRATRRRASASAEVNYTPQRINRRRSSLSLDNEEAIAAALTPQKRGGSSLRAKRTVSTLKLECPLVEDMGAIIEEVNKDNMEDSNDSNQIKETVKDNERVELKSIVPKISNVIEESICEEINTQKVQPERLNECVIEVQDVKVKGDKQAKSNAKTLNAISCTNLKDDAQVDEEGVNPVIDAQEIDVFATEIKEAPEQQHKPQSEDFMANEKVDKVEAELLDKSDYEYGKEVAQEIEDLKEQPKTPKAQKKSVRIADNVFHSPKTPVMVGMRELMKSPKTVDLTPKLIGIRDLMRTPKVAKVLTETNTIDEEEYLTGLADLVKTPKIDTVTRQNVNKEIAEKSEKEGEEQDMEPSTSTKGRGTFVGMRELLKTPKHTSTPQYRGMRELLRTPKACSTPQLGGLEELMQTPIRNKLHDKYDEDEDDENNEGLDQFLKTPRAKHVMIPGEPASAILEPSTDSSSLNIMTATTEYDLHSSHHQRTLEDIYKTPVSTRFSNVDTLTANVETSSATKKKDDDSEMIVPETPAQQITATTTKRTIAASEEACDVGRTSLDITPTQKVNTRKSHLASNLAIAALLSPFSAADIITDLPKTNIQEWVDNLQQSNELDEGEDEEREVTVSVSILNAAKDATHDPIASSVCDTSNLTVNKDTTEQMLADMSAVTTSEDPLLSSVSKIAYISPDYENETLRPATPNDAEISGINLLDQTNESVFSEPLAVSDTESIHGGSTENNVVEKTKALACEEPGSAENKSQDEEDFPMMFVESSDSEHEEEGVVIVYASASTQKDAESHETTISENKTEEEPVNDTIIKDIDDSKTSADQSQTTTEADIEFNNFQAHKTIAGQQMRASTPHRTTKARTIQSTQDQRRQSMGAEKQLTSITIDLTREKSRLVEEKVHKATKSECIIEVDESIEDAIEDVTKDDGNKAEFIENADEFNDSKSELNENVAETAAGVEWTSNSSGLSDNIAELYEKGELNKKPSELDAAESIENAAELDASTTELNKKPAELDANAAESIEKAAELDASTAELNQTAAEIRKNANEAKLNANSMLSKNVADINENAAELEKTPAESKEKAVELYENVAAFKKNAIEDERNENEAEQHEKIVELNANTVNLNTTSAELCKNEAELHENGAELPTKRLETTVGGTAEKLREEFGNFQAYKTIASRGKRAATPDLVNKRHELKISQAPRRLTLGAEQHLTGVNIDFVKEKSQLQNSKQLTEPLVESVQEIDHFINESAIETLVPQADVKQTNTAVKGDEDNVDELQKVLDTVQANTVAHATELEVDRGKSKIITPTASNLQKVIETTISDSTNEKITQDSESSGTTTDGAERTEEQILQIVKVVENLIPENPIAEATETVVAENHKSEYSTAKNYKQAIGGNKTVNSLGDQTKTALAKTEFNYSDVFDLTEDVLKDPPAVNTTQGVIFDLTEEENDAVVEENEANVTSDEETAIESTLRNTKKEQGIENSNDTTTKCQIDVISSTENSPLIQLNKESIPVEGPNNEVNADSTNKIEEFSGVTNDKLSVERTGVDLQKTDNEEFFLMTSMESVEDNIEISESKTEELQFSVEEIKEVTVESTKVDTHSVDISNANGEQVEANLSLKIVDRAKRENRETLAKPPALLLQDSVNNLDADVVETTKDTNVAIENGAADEGKEIENEGRDHTGNKQDELPSNSKENSASQIAFSEKIIKETLACDEQTKAVIDDNTQHSTKVVIEDAVEESVEAQNNTEETIDISTEKRNEEKVVGMQNEEEIQTEQSPEGKDKLIYKTPMESEILIAEEAGELQLDENVVFSDKRIENQTGGIAGEESTNIILSSAEVSGNTEGEAPVTKEIPDILEETLASSKDSEQMLVSADIIHISEETPANDVVANIELSKHVRLQEVSTIEKEMMPISAKKTALTDENKEKLVEKADASSSTFEKDQPVKRNQRKTSRSKQKNVDCVSEHKPEASHADISTMSPRGVDELDEVPTSYEKHPPHSLNVRNATIEKDESVANETKLKVVIQTEENQNAIAAMQTVGDLENKLISVKEQQQPAKRSVRKTSRSKQETDQNKETTIKATTESEVTMEESDIVDQSHGELITQGKVTETNVEESKHEAARKEEVTIPNVTDTGNEDILTVEELNEPTISAEKQPPGKRSVRKRSRSKQTTVQTDESAEKTNNETEVKEVMTALENKEVDTEMSTTAVEDVENKVHKPSRSKPAAADEDASVDKTANEKKTLGKELTKVQESQDTETTQAIGQVAKRSVRKTSRSKQETDQNKETTIKATIESEVTVEESDIVDQSHGELITQGKMTEKNVEESKNEAARKEEATIPNVTDTANEDILTVEELNEPTISAEKQPPGKRTVRKPSRSKQTTVQTDESAEKTNNETEVKEVMTALENKEVDTEMPTTAVEDVENKVHKPSRSKTAAADEDGSVDKTANENKTLGKELTRVQESQDTDTTQAIGQVAKRSVRKTSHSNKKVEQEEEIKYKATRVAKTTPLETAKEDQIENIESSRSLRTTLDGEQTANTEKHKSDSATHKIELPVEVSTSMPPKRKGRKPSGSKKNVEEKNEGTEKTTNVVKTLEKELMTVQKSQDTDAETQGEEQPAKRIIRKTSRSKHKFEQDEEVRKCQVTSIAETTPLETVKEVSIEHTEAETTSDREEALTTEEHKSDSTDDKKEVSAEATSSMPPKRKGRKPSGSKKNVEEKNEGTETTTNVVKTLEEELMTVQKSQYADAETQGEEQPAKRIIRKTSRSKHKFEQEEEVTKCQVTTVVETTPLETVKEVSNEHTEAETTSDREEASTTEKHKSDSTDDKKEVSAVATISMPPKRKGSKSSACKQVVEQKFSKESEQNAEKGNFFEAEEDLGAESEIAVDAIVTVPRETAFQHVTATYEVSLLKSSKASGKSVTSTDDETKLPTDQELTTTLKALDEVESIDISSKNKEEEHRSQRSTRRTRKGSATSQCSAQDGDDLSTTKRRGGRRHAETPVENSADEASAEAPTTTKRRRGPAAKTDVCILLEEIKEVLLDDGAPFKEQAGEEKPLDIDDHNETKIMIENDENVTENPHQANEPLMTTACPAEENPEDEGKSADTEKALPETKAEKATISRLIKASDEIEADVDPEESKNAVNTPEEEVRELQDATAHTNASRRGGRRKRTASESSQTSNTPVENIDGHAILRGRRRRKAATEEPAVDIVKAVAAIEETTTSTEAEVKITEMKKGTEDEQHSSSSSSQTIIERALKEKKEDASDLPSISIESSEEVFHLKSESQKENITLKEEEQSNEEPTTTGRKRANRYRKADATDAHRQQTENVEHTHKEEEKLEVAETHTKTRKVVKERTDTPTAADSVGGRRGRRGAAAAATVAINEVASAHKRGTPRGKSQQNTSQTKTTQGEEHTRKRNSTETVTPHDEEPNAVEIKKTQNVVRRKRRGSVTVEDGEKEKHESEDETIKAKKVTKSVRQRRVSAHSEETENVHAEDKGTTSSVSSMKQRSRRKRVNSIQSVGDDEVTAIIVDSAGADVEPPKKRPLSSKRRDSSLDSSIHEGTSSNLEAGNTSACGGNTSSVSTTPNRPRRAVTAEERNYDESSDAEVQVELKRRIEKASMPKGSSSSSITAATNSNHGSTSATGSSTTGAEVTSKAEAMSKSARSTPILSTVFTTSRGGRQRKPTARVQQYLEEERAKAETPKKRLLLGLAAGGGAETPSTSQTASSTPARRTRKPSAAEAEITEAQQTPSRVRPRKLKTATVTYEESRSETHSENETTQSTIVVEEKDKALKVGKRTTTRRGKQTVSATTPTESELSETQEAPPTTIPTQTVNVSRNGRAAKAAATAAVISDDQAASDSQTKTNAVRRGRRGAHADTAATDDEQHADVDTKDVEDDKKSKKTKTTTDAATVGQTMRTGRGGSRHKKNDAEESEASNSGGQQTIVIDADDEHEEEDDEVVLMQYVEREEENKTLAKVKKTTAATKKRTGTVEAGAVNLTESPVPKRVRRRGGDEKDADVAPTGTTSNSRSRKVVHFKGAPAASAPATRATRSRRK
ncbi:microtubule-associated protein futsch isoform X2 [Eurosta solidaginis]|uniref:microtubule-associated protein futsch isoform X2 n=1 Tax=Eurosta solidaginis TaxID=178769 RepID=UPI003530C2C9